MRDWQDICLPSYFSQKVNANLLGLIIPMLESFPISVTGFFAYQCTSINLPVTWATFCSSWQRKPAETQHVDWNDGYKSLSSILSKILKSRWANFIEYRMIGNCLSKKGKSFLNVRIIKEVDATGEELSERRHRDRFCHIGRTVILGVPFPENGFLHVLKNSSVNESTWSSIISNIHYFEG